MPAAAALLLVVIGVVIALRGRPVPALSVLAAAWLLVPGGMRVPYTGLGPLFVQRVIVLAVLVGLGVGLLTGRLQRGLFAPRGVHLAFAGFLAVAAVVGVAFAPVDTLSRQNADGWIALAEQAAFFVAALALFRACGPRRSVQVVAAVAAVLAAIAISEWLFDWSYAAWVTRGTPDPTGLLSLPLETRGGDVRVRASATFALELGWIVAMLVPVSVAAAIASRPRRYPWVVPVLLVIALVLSQSRSAYAGLAIGAVVILIGIVLDRPRQLAAVGAVGLAVVALLIEAPLRTAAARATLFGERDVRFDRLPDVLEAAADRPHIGTGLGGLLSEGIDVVDVSWVGTYATLGVLGVVAVAALLVAAIHAATRFVRAGPSDLRVIAAAGAGALLAAVVGMFSYDLFTLRSSTATLWAVTALALAANEELGVLRFPVRSRRPPLRVYAMALVGGAVAAVAVFAAPRPAAVTAVFTTVDPAIAAAAIDQSFTVKVLSQSACLVVTAVRSPATIECRDRDQLAGGIGEIRVEAPNAREAEAALAVVEEQLVDTFPAATLQVRARQGGFPAWVATAPIWMPALGIALGALIPLRPGVSGGTDRTGRARTRPVPLH